MDFSARCRHSKREDFLRSTKVIWACVLIFMSCQNVAINRKPIILVSVRRSKSFHIWSHTESKTIMKLKKKTKK